MSGDLVPGLVTVVIAAYNRPNVLRLAIETVLWQTHPHWELWVIGDACKERPEGEPPDPDGYVRDAVESFGDPRIRFFNFAENFGEQSRQNNEGVRRARGEFVAFLNHDDLWARDHLAIGLAELARSGADLVFAAQLSVESDGLRVRGDIPGGRYSPQHDIYASTWIVRKRAFDEVGPWRPARELYNAPSQEWIFRAWWAGEDLRYGLRWFLRRGRGGKIIRCTGRVTVVCVSSLIRDASYRQGKADEQRRYFELLKEGADADPRAPQERPAEPATLGQAIRRRRTLAEAWRTARFVLAKYPRHILVRRIPLLFGIHPLAAELFFLRGPKPGENIRWLRERRGLRREISGDLSSGGEQS